MSDETPLADSSDPAPTPPERGSIWRGISFVSFSVAVVLTLAFAFSDGGLAQLRRARERHRKLEVEIRALAAQNSEHVDRIAALSSDPAAVEKLAREELGLVRPGEVVFLLPPPQETPAPAALR